jgi:hypothetical protein
VIFVFNTELRIVFHNADAGAQRFQTLTVLLHPTQNGTYQACSLTVRRGRGNYDECGYHENQHQA